MSTQAQPDGTIPFVMRPKQDRSDKFFPFDQNPVEFWQNVADQAKIGLSVQKVRLMRVNGAEWHYRLTIRIGERTIDTIASMSENPNYEPTIVLPILVIGNESGLLETDLDTGRKIAAYFNALTENRLGWNDATIGMKHVKDLVQGDRLMSGKVIRIVAEVQPVQDQPDKSLIVFDDTFGKDVIMAESNRLVDLC